MKRKKLNNSEEKNVKKRTNSKILWAVLAVLVVGFVSLVLANAETFRLPIPSTANSSCGSSMYGIQDGVSVSSISSRCRPLTKEQQAEKRWRDIIAASPVVIAASGMVTALSLTVLTWQVSKLVRILGKRQ